VTIHCNTVIAAKELDWRVSRLEQVTVRAAVTIQAFERRIAMQRVTVAYPNKADASLILTIT